MLRLVDVCFHRDGNAILDGVGWTVRPGERWVVLGPNGAGKSTLLRIAAAREMPTRGRVSVLGEELGRVDVRELRARVGLHTPLLARQLAPGQSVREAVVTGTDGALRRFRQEYTPEQWRRADDLLRDTGCAALSPATVDRLSDGELQRVLLARALMPRPELLLLDEPAANLDLGGRMLLREALASLAGGDEIGALVLVTHNLDEVPAGFTHALLLRGGRVVAAGPLEETLTPDTVGACFGAPMQRTS
jgi:iron complex transport system ATP-binding protein